jgi:glycosyltransferase involved in cell wall biosynthesis
MPPVENSNSIAVIIPTYNSMKHFKETIESVLKQTLPPDEILVNDDGSTDGTPDFAESYGPPIRVFRRANQRQSASRNFAATQTQCEWLAFLDHDDLWKPDKLQRQMEELIRNPAADLCYCGRISFDEDNGSFRPGNVFAVPPARDIRRALYVNTTFMPGSVLIRRTTYLAFGGFNPSIKLVEDWDLWLRLIHAGVQFAACQEPLLSMRMHAGNQSNSAIAALEEQKEIYRRLVLPHLPRSTRWLARQRSQSGQEAVAATILRNVGDPRCLSMMLTSIVRYPFAKLDRYKILAHMFLTRLGFGWRRAEASTSVR